MRGEWVEADGTVEVLEVETIQSPVVWRDMIGTIVTATVSRDRVLRLKKRLGIQGTVLLGPSITKRWSHYFCDDQ